MAKKHSPDPLLHKIRLAAIDEDHAVDFLEERRWGEEALGASCPRCESNRVYQMRDRSGARNKDYRWRCRACVKMFTVRTGTIFEETRLPLRVWCHALWRANSSKKGVSALQISRECEISYKSALFLMHRIRHIMGVENEPTDKLGGIVEADETYVGGKPRVSKQRSGFSGRGTKKTPVFGAVERGGKVRLQTIKNATGKTLGESLGTHVDKTSALFTDSFPAYIKPARSYAIHQSVNHSRGEYVRGIVHTNTIESVFALVKRSIYGTFHSVSKKHLHRYLNEFVFRYNLRAVSDADRTSVAIDAVVGRRLRYKEVLGG